MTYDSKVYNISDKFKINKEDIVFNVNISFEEKKGTMKEYREDMESWEYPEDFDIYDFISVPGNYRVIVERINKELIIGEQLKNEEKAGLNIQPFDICFKNPVMEPILKKGDTITYDLKSGQKLIVESVKTRLGECFICSVKIDTKNTQEYIDHEYLQKGTVFTTLN